MSRQCSPELEKIAAGGEEGGSHGCGRVSLELSGHAARPYHATGGAVGVGGGWHGRKEEE